ncbi:GntR family transcriptional regulator [soil metagenome]
MSQTTQLYERLRAAILALELAPGERLTERSLEASFAASRTPVRAALSRLEGEGLVVRDGRGYSVAPLDLAEIRSLAELREAVEAAAVRLAVERATPEQLESLDAAHPTDAGASVRAGGDFHARLAALSGNPFLAESVRAAMTRLERTRWLEVRTPQAREQAWREHRAVLDAVVARDADAASALLIEHIRATNERLVAALEANPVRVIVR